MSIASEITRLQNAKTAIKTSIENKGVTVGDGTLDTYATKIDQIDTGTPINNQDKTLTANGSYTADSGYTGLGTVTVNVDTSQVINEYFKTTGITTNASSYGWKSFIKKVPDITISGTSADYLFYNYPFSSFPNITNFENLKSAYNMFNSCTFTEFPYSNKDFSKITNMASMCQSCRQMTTMGAIDCSSVTNISAVVTFCNALVDFGGFTNLGKAYTGSPSGNSNTWLYLNNCNNLSHDSLLNVLNGLWNRSSSSSHPKVVLGQTNYNKLTAEEIAIGTNKGWDIVVS